MGHVNIEIKARCSKPDRVRAFLRAAGADFKGIDHQIDTYFRVPTGRLKLRPGGQGGVGRAGARIPVARR